MSWLDDKWDDPDGKNRAKHARERQISAQNMRASHTDRLDAHWLCINDTPSQKARISPSLTTNFLSFAMNTALATTMAAGVIAASGDLETVTQQTQEAYEIIIAPD